MRAGAAIAATLLLAGCSHIQRKAGVTGWFTVDETAGIAYPARFSPVGLDGSGDCAALRQRVAVGTQVVVLVHGVKGDGTEMLAPIDALAKLPAHHLLLYRWVPWQDRDAVISGLVAGVNALTACLADRKPRTVMLCHSAGGVACAWAAHLLKPPEGMAVTVVTVASPLAGSNGRQRRGNDEQEAVFMLDLGSGIERYPAAAPGVQVIHLRTNPKADPVMRLNGAHSPNDPAVGVIGSLQVDLPETIGHDASLAYAVDRLIEAGGDPAAAQW